MVEDRGQHKMANRNCQLLFLDPLSFLGSLSLDLLRRRRVGMVDAANWIGTTLTTCPRLPPSMTMASAIFSHGC